MPRIKEVRAALGGLDVDSEAVVATLARSSCHRYLRLADESSKPRKLREIVVQLEIEDLVLSVACGLGSEPAWKVFHARYAEFIRSSVYQFARHPSDVPEIVQGFYAELYLPRSGGNNAISRFLGWSTLKTWLRTVLLYRVTDFYARSGPEVQLSVLDGESVGSRAVSPSTSSNFHSRLLGDRVRDALRDVMGSLSGEERSVLEDYYVQGQTVIEIGNKMGVHKASVSRWLKQIRGRLLYALKRELGGDFPQSAEEVSGFLDSLSQVSGEQSRQVFG